jgi:hypothetical protein
MRHLFSNRPVRDGGAVTAGRDLRSVHSAHSSVVEMIINTRPCACLNCETAERIWINFVSGGGGGGYTEFGKVI